MSDSVGPHRRQPTSPPTTPGILQARTLGWAAISFSNAWQWKVKVKSFSRVRLLRTPWTTAYQAPPSMGFSRQEDWSGVPLPSPLNTLSFELFCPLACHLWDALLESREWLSCSESVSNHPQSPLAGVLTCEMQCGQVSIQDGGPGNIQDGGPGSIQDGGLGLSSGRSGSVVFFAEKEWRPSWKQYWSFSLHGNQKSVPNTCSLVALKCQLDCLCVCVFKRQVCHIMCRSISQVLILFHWPVNLPKHQYYIVLISMSNHYVLKSCKTFRFILCQVFLFVFGSTMLFKSAYEF